MLATCGWSATTRHTGDKHDKGTLRDQGNAMTWEHFQGYLANMTHPKTGDDARGDGKHGGL